MSKKTFFITGANSGFGLAIATAASRQGHMVVGTIRSEASRASLTERLPAVRSVLCDVTEFDRIPDVVEQAEADYGPVDVLINNAGVGGEGRALDMTPEAWDQAFNVNVRGVFFCAQAAARQMIAADLAASRGGRIVNIASIAAHTVLPGLSAHNASKAAVGMMTKALAREWARHHIAVNALCPGYVETDINSAWFATENGQKQVRGFPRRRLMEAADLDAALLMLAGPAAAAITGTLVTVDDGQSLP